jgi:hypothetical protein
MVSRSGRLVEVGLLGLLVVMLAATLLVYPTTCFCILSFTGLVVLGVLWRNKVPERVPTSMGVLQLRGRKGRTETGWQIRLEFRDEFAEVSRPDGAVIRATLWVDWRDGIANVEFGAPAWWKLNDVPVALEPSERQSVVSITRAALEAWGLSVEAS